MNKHFVVLFRHKTRQYGDFQLPYFLFCLKKQRNAHLVSGTFVYRLSRRLLLTHAEVNWLPDVPSAAPALAHLRLADSLALRLSLRSLSHYYFLISCRTRVLRDFGQRQHQRRGCLRASRRFNLRSDVEESRHEHDDPQQPANETTHRTAHRSRHRRQPEQQMSAVLMTSSIVRISSRRSYTLGQSADENS